MKKIQVEGRNPVLEMLRRHVTVVEMFLDGRARPDKKLEEILALAREQKTIIKQVERNQLNTMSATGVHMGLIAFVEPPPLPTRLKDLLHECRAKNEDPFLLLINDTLLQQNLGAITRTANAAGVHGIIVPRKQENPLTPEVIRVSMGAALFTPIINESIFTAFKTLKSEGIPVTGVDMDGEILYSAAPLQGSIALLLGGEHKGLSEPEIKRCRQLVRIPMKGIVSSLNISAACAILVYEKLRQDRERR